MANLQTFQNHVVFRSFSDLYCEEKRQERASSQKSGSSSTSSSRASSFSFNAAAPSVAYTGYNKMSRSSTRVSLKQCLVLVSTSIKKLTLPLFLFQSSIDSSSSALEAQYYPAALYNSRMTQKMAQREMDTATLNDEVSSESTQDLSLRRY